MDYAKLDFLLDLFCAGYKNAYVSVMDIVSEHNISYTRIELFLPNVGRLCLHQSFDESLDEQIPCYKVFCSNAIMPTKEIQIQNPEFLKRAAWVVYKAKEFFETHPEYMVTDENLMQRIESNQKLLKKQHDIYSKKHRGILQSFTKEK